MVPPTKPKAKHEDATPANGAGASDTKTRRKAKVKLEKQYRLEVSFSYYFRIAMGGIQTSAF